MELDIEAKTVFLQDIFTAYAQYFIPAYQRPYSWEKKQTAALLNDICDVQGEKSYFMATIMMRKTSPTFNDNEGEKITKIELIDGQQRLVTLLVLFRVLERILAAKGRKIKMVQPIQLADNKTEQRVLLNGSTAQSCLDAILRNDSCNPTPWQGETTAEARLIEMEEYYLNYLQVKNDEELGRISGVIKAQLVFCVLTVKGTAESGALFEGQNARGYPLTTLDLTKNWLIYIASKADAPQALIASINKTWETIFKALYQCRIGDSETEMQYVRCIDRIMFSLEGSSYDNLKQKVTVNNLASLVAAFEGCIKYFVGLYRPNLAPDVFESQEDNNEFRTYAEKLNNMGKVAEFLPLLCVAFYRFGKNALPILKHCEKFAFRVYAVASKKKSTGERDLIRLAHSVFNNESDVEGCKTVISKCALSFCDDSKFSSDLWRKNYEWKYVKYLLMEYALHLEKDKKFILAKKPNEFQIEHIASQQSMNVTEAMAEELVHSIGNLSITYGNRNQQYSNKPFVEKTALYKTSELTIETILASKKEWQKSDIEARTKEIADWATKRWSTISTNS